MARQRRIAALMDDRDHLRNCPDPLRVEAYASIRPAQPQNAVPARPVTIVRCQECGGSMVLEQPYETTVAQLAADDNAN